MDQLYAFLTTESASRDDVCSVLAAAMKLKDIVAELSKDALNAAQADASSLDLAAATLRRTTTKLVDFIKPPGVAEHASLQPVAELGPNQAEFRVGDRFSDLDAVKLATDTYHRATGFKLAVANSKNVSNGLANASLAYHCKHSGSARSSLTSGRLGCAMSVTFKRPKDSTEYVVTECSAEHTVPRGDHPPPNRPTLSAEQERDFRRIVAQLSEGMRLCDAMRAAETVLGARVSTAESRAVRNRIDAANRAGRLNSQSVTDLEELLAWASQDDDAVVKLVTGGDAVAPADAENQDVAVIGIVLSSTAQLSMLRLYGDVLLVDATYSVLTESSFAYSVFSVVVVTRHMRNFTCLHAFIANEQTATYTAVFRAIEALLGGCTSHARTIIADGAVSMRNSLAAVFPDSTLLTCRFHKLMNFRTHRTKLTQEELNGMAASVDALLPRFDLLRKVQGLGDRKKSETVREALVKVFNELVYSCEEPGQFLALLDSLLAAWPAGRGLGNVFDKPEDFVYAYTKHVFCAGESTSSRVESENSALKHWVRVEHGRRVTLKELYEVVKKRTARMLRKQDELDRSSATTTMSCACLRALRGIITINVLREVYEHVVAVEGGGVTMQARTDGVSCKGTNGRTYLLTFSADGPPSDCSCKYTNRKGMPCEHIVAARLLGYRRVDGCVGAFEGADTELTAADFAKRWWLPGADAARGDDDVHLIRDPVEVLAEELRSVLEDFDSRQREVLGAVIRAQAYRTVREHRSGAAVFGRGLVQVAAAAPGRPRTAGRDALRRDPSEFEHREHEASASADALQAAGDAVEQAARAAAEQTARAAAEQTASASTGRTAYRCSRCHQHGHTRARCRAAECSDNACDHRAHSKRPRQD
jgi:hypothetical protein